MKQAGEMQSLRGYLKTTRQLCKTCQEGTHLLLDLVGEVYVDDTYILTPSRLFLSIIDALEDLGEGKCCKDHVTARGAEKFAKAYENIEKVYLGLSDISIVMQCIVSPDYVNDLNKQLQMLGNKV